VFKPKSLSQDDTQTSTTANISNDFTTRLWISLLFLFFFSVNI
jgi:hypothetical protein